MTNEVNIQKHTAITTILLHLFPGLANLIVIILFIPIMQKCGFIPQTAGFMDIISMVPIQLGILLFTAKKTTGTYKLSKIMPFLKKNKFTEYLIFIVIMVVYALLISKLLEPFENYMRDTLFAFYPDTIAMRNFNISQFPKSSLVFFAILGIFANGIIAPIVEELYFRGFLLPRINLSPLLAVIVNAALFSLYHFFSPWQFFSRLLMMIPVYFWVVKRQDIRFSLAAHLTANLFTSVAFLVTVLSL
jgi:membrane protease YdiL (CAAX protease family)